MKLVRRLLVSATVLCSALAPQAADAWDPSTTHIGLTQRAAVDSAVHSRWMRSTELQRGLFTAVRLDPARLSPAQLRLVKKALRNAPAASGAQALGGPGACPGALAPRSTQRFCVDGDLWQQTALGWIELGMVAELVPPDRGQHHFVDRNDRTAANWRDGSARGWLLRSRSTRNNGAPLAGSANRTNFAGRAMSAVGWVADETDLLAPTQLHHHLERAYTSKTQGERDHHLALALICTGALLHVVQDLAVPAHARGDVQAFFQPLSETRGDRGLVLQEYARQRFGRRALPKRSPEDIAADRGRPLADSVVEHMLGDPDTGFEGLATFAATRFLSAGRLPPPVALSQDLTAEDAAATLLVDSGLDPVETEGAKLAPWPATAGYLLTATGRPLAAFERDDFGRIRTFLDEAVFRDTLALVLPQALGTSRSLLDHLWPAFPPATHNLTAGTLEFDVPATIVQPELLIARQNTDAERTLVVKSVLTAGKRNRVANLPTDLADGERLVAILRGQHTSGEPMVVEHILDPGGAGIPAEQLAPTSTAGAASTDEDEDDEEVEGLLELEEGELLTSPDEPDPTVESDPAAPTNGSESATSDPAPPNGSESTPDPGAGTNAPAGEQPPPGQVP